jgi:hypothetical protein
LFIVSLRFIKPQRGCIKSLPVHTKGDYLSPVVLAVGRPLEFNAPKEV